MKKKFILGICGCIGSGKSEALKVLSERGWFVIDADKIVRELYGPGGAGQRKIADFFGEEFLRKDGSVNRLKLRKVVFSDVKKLKILNLLIHPLVFNEIGKILDKVGAREGLPLKVAIEAVYFEGKYLGKIVDKLLLIDRPARVVATYLMKKRGFMPSMVKNVLALDLAPKVFDVKISNNSTLKEFKEKVIIEAEKLTS